MRRYLIPLILCFFLVGCTTTKRLGQGDVAPFQTLSQDGDLLFVIAGQDQAPLVLQLLGSDELAKRCRRISASFTCPTYPIDLENTRYRVLLEGDYPTFIINIALSKTEGFVKQDDGSYRNGDISIIALGGGNILVTNGDVQTEKQRLLQAPPTIDNVTAGTIANSSFCLFSTHPTTFVKIEGFSQGSVDNTDSLMIHLDGEHIADAKFVMKSEKVASTLNKLLRSAYMADLRRSGDNYSIDQLKEMFTLEGNILIIQGMKLSDEKWASLTGSFSSLL